MITLHSLPRAIVHLDCDAFFASVEQALNPGLKGRPVITGKERGIATSMSIEAKRRGVRRAMRLFEVKKICPDCVILPNDYETYSLFSRRVMGIMKRFTPELEEYSIDEAYADLTGLRRVYRTSYEEIARRMKNTVETELGISVSVGLSLTKTLAKICSKHQKPSGFTCVKGYELHEFLKDIPVQEVCGLGPNSVHLLRKYGVNTAWDYVHRPDHLAKKLLGKIGIELWRELRGETVYPVDPGPKKAQITLSKAKTFSPPSNNKDFVRAQLLRNLESAFIKLRRHRLRTKNLGIFLTDSEFKCVSVGATLTRATSSAHETAPVAYELVEHLFDPKIKYRQTGIYLSGLEADKEIQGELFEDPVKIRVLRQISECVDRVNARHGKHALHMASTSYLNPYTQHFSDRGDLAKRKINLFKGETFRQRIGIPVWNIKV